MRAIARATTTSLTAVVAYAVAIVAYGAIVHLSQLPDSTLWDDSLRVAVRFILLMLALIALLVPGIRSDADAVTRTASVLCALTLAAYAALKISGMADPDIPEKYVLHALEPVKARFGL